ncbi:MAG: hypothetical protein HYW50_00880 [Candidatus Diapherotrites archaeon]|nr:hypothetical protein [Candidatus Diapherotrites archaeon]
MKRFFRWLGGRFFKKREKKKALDLKPKSESFTGLMHAIGEQKLHISNEDIKFLKSLNDYEIIRIKREITAQIMAKTAEEIQKRHAAALAGCLEFYKMEARGERFEPTLGKGEISLDPLYAYLQQYIPKRLRGIYKEEQK